MSVQPSNLQALAANAAARGFPWPADDEPLHLAQGPVSAALVRALLGGARGPAALPVHPASWRPSVIMAAPRGGAGEALGESSPLTLDVALVALDLLQRGGGQTPLNPRIVLARKAYRRWGHERQAFESRVAAEIRLLQRFKLLTEDGPEPLLVLGPRNVARTDFVVRAAPSLAVEIGERDWIELPVSVLRLDHRRNRGVDVLAKKLATVIALSGSSGAFGVADLLMQAGMFPDGRGGRRRRMAERLPEALRRVQALGAFEIDGVDTLERRGAGHAEWLNAQIRVRRRSPLVVAMGTAGAPGRRPGAHIDSAETSHRSPGRRGRPRFEPSPQQRNDVRTLVARGATREQIARAVGVSLPTLRNYFSAELREAGGAFIDGTWPEDGDLRGKLSSSA